MESPLTVLIMKRFPLVYCIIALYMQLFVYSNGWWAELISKRQDGSRVYVMLHPLCQARLGQHRGEKGMDKGNKGTASFQPGWLPGCDIAYVEILQLCWDKAGHKSRVIQQCSAKSEHVLKKGMHANTPCLSLLHVNKLWLSSRKGNLHNAKMQ